MPELNTYWRNHLAVAFADAAAHDLPAMVEASLAHVVMLTGTGALSRERGAQLERGLLELWGQWRDGVDTPEFDGTVEDPYYYFEQQLAAALQVSPSELDVQLGRSRNDLDAAVFRMVLRNMLLEQGKQLGELVGVLLDRAANTMSAVLIGMTHRRPAQPTTISHVLGGLVEAWLELADELLRTYDVMNVSPLGGAAFAGTDIPYNADEVASLLGFDSRYEDSYEAIAGASHFERMAALHGSIGALSARWARVLQEWMSLGWIHTPREFTQGSSIMPQKVNPVVCEHLVSMAGATNADMQAVFANVAASWYEDSNNATTDVQQHLWRSSERLARILRLQIGLARALEPLNLPTREEIVESGATTTAVAEVLSLHGVPWRSAHDVVRDLTSACNPMRWTKAQVEETLSFNQINPELADSVLQRAQDPAIVLQRTQPGSPGVAPMQETIRRLLERAQDVKTALNVREIRLNKAREQLLVAASELVAS